MPPPESTMLTHDQHTTDSVLAAVDGLVAAQWSIAADREVLSPVLAGAAALAPLGSLLVLLDDQGNLRTAAALTSAPDLRHVFESLDPGGLDCVARAATSGQPVWTRTTDGHQMELALEPVQAGVGAWSALPLQSGSNVIGVLATAFTRPLVFDEGQRSLLLALGRLTALALTSGFVSDDDNDTVVLQVAQERERLARDLHDGVVQDVIAAAMNLASLTRLVPDAVRPRIEHIIESHDAIVRELRKTIFALRVSQKAGLTASGELIAVAAEAENTLGFRPTLHLSGPVDEIDPITLGHLRLSLHEMLANVARHAAAGHVDVTVTVDGQSVGVVVVDDGLGLTPHARRGDGLDNLAHRAHQLGGRCDFSSGSRGGAIVRWSVPRPPTSHHGATAEKDPT